VRARSYGTAGATPAKSAGTLAAAESVAHVIIEASGSGDDAGFRYSSTADVMGTGNEPVDGTIAPLP
jgi:hypothetical protein